MTYPSENPFLATIPVEKKSTGEIFHCSNREECGMPMRSLSTARGKEAELSRDQAHDLLFDPDAFSHADQLMRTTQSDDYSIPTGSTRSMDPLALPTWTAN